MKVTEVCKGCPCYLPCHFTNKGVHIKCKYCSRVVFNVSGSETAELLANAGCPFERNPGIPELVCLKCAWKKL